MLKHQALEYIEEIFPKARIVCIYQFTDAKTLENIQTHGIQTLKWPVSWQEIEHVTLSEYGFLDNPHGFAPRQFSDEELIGLATALEDDTNCPQFLIEGIQQLNAFSTYVGECMHIGHQANRYASLRVDISQARLILENALEAMAEHHDPAKLYKT